jgi:hypothetical protein
MILVWHAIWKGFGIHEYGDAENPGKRVKHNKRKKESI